MQEADSGAAKCGCRDERPSGQLETMRKHRSVETRWANSFLSPEEPRWDLRGRAAKSTEFRWELHTSQTDVDIARNSRANCSCHSFYGSDEKRPGDRGDLRKHHSAETDKWSLHPDAAIPRHHLRKHNSDDTRMARDARWTLQVPDILPNPKTRCTCPKAKRLSLSPVDSQPSINQREDFFTSTLKKDLASASSSKSASKKHSDAKDGKSPDVRVKPAGRELKRQTRIDSQGSSKRWETKDHLPSKGEGQKLTQARWAGETQLSLPVETRGTTWLRGQRSLGEMGLGNKTGTRDKQKPETCTSLSLEPIRVGQASVSLDGSSIDSTTNGRHIFPSISFSDSKWASYEGQSPLPSVSAKKNEQEKLVKEDFKESWSPFRHVTPTCFPPPQSSPNANKNDDGRWKFLNQISPFPIYQGAWKECSPSDEVYLQIVTPENPPKLSPKIIDPELIKGELIRRAKSEEAPVQTSAESRSRQRPQLLRSKALLEVPAIDPAKRSLSEEVPRYRMNETMRGPNRARSEEGSKYGDPWFANNLVAESTEMCQYVTTV